MPAIAFCHASESWHPDEIEVRWMPAFAGMTESNQKPTFLLKNKLFLSLSQPRQLLLN